MLVEPGPIVPLDLAWFERALAPEAALSFDETAGAEIASAADAIDAHAATMRTLDPPDDVDDSDTGQLDQAQADAAGFVADALTGFPDEVNENLATGYVEMENFQAEVTSRSLIALPSLAPQSAGIRAGVDELPADSDQGDTPLPTLPGDDDAPTA